MSQESFINYKSVEETECTVNQELKLIKQNAQSVIEQLNMYFESSQQNLREMEEVYFASIQELESGFIYLMNQFRQSYNEQKECYQKEYEEKKFNLANEMNKTQRYIQDLALLEAIDGSMSFMQVQKCLKNLNKISDEIKVFYNQTHVQSFQLETINVDALLMKILQNLLFDSIYQRPKTKLFAQKISKQRSFSSSSQALQTSSMYYTGSSCENKEDEIVEKINTDSYHSRIKSSSSGQLEAKKEFKQEMHQTSPYSEKQPKIESFQVEQVQVEKEKNQKQLQENSSQQKQEKTMKQQYESIPYLKKYKTPNELSSIKKLSANYEKEKDEQKSYLKGLKQKIPKQSVKKNVFQHQTLSTQQNQKNTEQINRTPEKKKKIDMLIQQINPQQSTKNKLQASPPNPKKNQQLNKGSFYTHSSPIINRLRNKIQSSHQFSKLKKSTNNQSINEIQKLKTIESPQFQDQSLLRNEEVLSLKLNSSDDLNVETTENTSQTKVQTLKTSEHDQIAEQNNVLNRSIGLGQCNSSDALKLNSMSSKRIKMGITNPEMLQLSKDYSADNINQSSKENYTNRKRITSCGGFIEKQSTFNNLNKTQIVNHISSSLNNSPATNPLNKLSNRNLFNRDRSLSGFRQNTNKEKFLDKSLQNDEIIQEFQLDQSKSSNQQQQQKCLFYSSPISACLSSAVQQNYALDNNLNQDNYDQCEFQESPQIFLNYNISGLSQINNIQTVESISIEGRNIQQSQCEASLFRNKIQNSVKKAVIPRQQIAIDQEQINHSSPSDLNLITTECFQQKNIHEIQNLFTNPSPISHSASNEMQLFTSQNFENGSIITSQYYLNQQQSACLLNSKQKIEKIESGSKLNKSQSNQNQNSYRAIYLSQKNGQLDKNCQQNQIQQNNLTKTAPQLSNCNTNFVQSNQHQQANQIQNSFVNQQNQHKNILINKSINNQNQRYNEITDFTQNTINNQNEISAQKQNQQEIFIQNEFDTQIDNQNNFYEIQIQRKNQNQNEDNQNKNSFYNRKEDSMTEFIKNENIVNSQDNNENIANQKINQNNQPTAATQQKQENQIINQIKQDSQNLHKGLFYHSYTNHGLISTRTINEEQDDEEEQSTQNINNRINTEQVQQTKYVNKMNLTQQLSNKERNNLGSLIQEANQQQNNNKQINQNNNNSQSISINNNFQKDLQANQNNSLQKCTISQQNILFQGKNDQNQFLDQQTIQNQVFSCHQLENANSAQCSKTNLLSQRDNKESVTVQASNKFQSKNINPLPPTANSKVQANNSKQNKIENINQNQFENQKQSQTEHLRQDSQKNPIGQNKNNENMCDQDYSYAQSNNKKDINEYLQSQDSVRQKSNQFAQAPSSRARSFSECSERIDYKLNYQPAYQNDSQTKLSLSRSNSNYQICTFERKIDKPLSSRQSSQTGEYNHNNCQQYFQGIEDSGSSCSNNYSANFGIINFRELVEQRIKNKDAQNSFKIKVKSSQYSNVNNLNQLKAVESSCSNVIIQQNNIFNQEVTDQSEMQQKNISNYQKVSSQIQIICTDNSQHTTPQQSIINQVQDSVQKQQQKLIEKNQPVPTHKYLLANYKKNDMGTTNQLSQALQQQTSIQQFQGEQVRHKVNSLNVKNTLNSPSPTLNPQPTQLRVNSIQNLMPQPQQNLQCQNNMSYKQENKAVCCLNYNMVQLGGNDCDSLGEIISNQGEIIKKINYNLPRNLLDFKDPGYYGFSCVMLPQSNCILFIGGYFAERNDEKQYNKKQLFSYEQKQQSSSEYKRIFTKDIIKYNINEDSFSSFTFKLSNFSYDLTAIYIEKSNEIFLIGGRDENDQILQDCMIINIKENRIIQKQPLPYSLTGFCCTYETSKENVYVLGGIISNKITNSAYKLSLSYTDSEQHSHLNEWSQMHNMINCRVGAQCKIIKKNLYVFGGYDGRLYLNSVEMYNFDLNKWFIITFMKIPRAFYSLVSDQDKILIIGGKASTQITANNIDIFDVSKDEWQSINCYNINRNNHYTFLLKQIPNQGNQTAHNQNHS
ncbi:kelch motif protein (macronuclear) [Tetrahymena thermophila SB210]|uniref:Kelch motif protein n=1 Tax=Tetrahymena thermophila (strain SB210) TaxID=312017 RepID=Q22M93_TETTS|nr:kelch motif protein [Tetrahymena thermophila SB210]EAR86579.2 kelch motif protein [Tetrahymena thermophila SB210]|eukprot:XP_977127.2 kelch motif protein [Tetrahymena thermophila SB210]